MASKTGDIKSGGTEGASPADAGAADSATADGSDRNAVMKTRPRARGPAQGQPANPGNARAAPRAPVVNSIRQSRPRVVGAGDGPERHQDEAGQDGKAGRGRPEPTRDVPMVATADSPAETADRHAVPEHVRRRFVQVGRKYYFPDGARAFTDRGHRLTTPSENTEVIRSLVAIAQTRGWSEIAVRGTGSFRREAWFAARLMGLDVRGYRPTDIEQARLVRTLASRQPGSVDSAAEAQPPRGSAKGSRRDRASPRSETAELITGRLVEHGRAPFQHDKHQPMSYFVKIKTAEGERVIWGVDFERAFAESLTKPQAGDEIGLRAVRKDIVTVKVAERDKAGKVIGEKELDALRNRWIVEKRAFFDARNAAAETVRDRQVPGRAAVKTHPELVGTYLQIRAAELAAEKIRDPNDRTRFVSTVRAALAESVARGEPAPRVKLRERTASRPPGKSRGARSAEQAPARS